MDKFDRFQLLHRHFRSHRNPISVTRLAELLECSEKTVKRTIEQMRDYIGAPIEYFSEQRGWHYKDKDQDLYELPGLWLTSRELQSLAMMLQLLDTFGSGLLHQELGVVDGSIDRLLAARGIEKSHFEQHVRVLPFSNRYVPNQRFSLVCEGLLSGKQLEMQYVSFTKTLTKRIISPQTLVYYRENWYLDAWCHLRKELRTFSLARIAQVEILKSSTTVSIPVAEMREHFTASYGIFSGEVKFTATLRFSTNVAREISSQQWHPDQQGNWDGDEYLLSIPYSDDRELIQDVLRHTPNVYVESPFELRAAVAERLAAGLTLNSGNAKR